MRKGILDCMTPITGILYFKLTKSVAQKGK